MSKCFYSSVLLLSVLFFLTSFISKYYSSPVSPPNTFSSSLFIATFFSQFLSSFVSTISLNHFAILGQCIAMYVSLRAVRWRQHIPIKCWYPSTTLHSITSQKTTVFIFLTVIISDPTYIINVLKFNVSQYTLYFIGPLSLPRSSQSPGEPRNKRLRRLSSTEEEMDLGAGRDKGTGEVTYYGQSPASLSSQTSWHSDVDHGGLGTLTFLSLVILINICTYKIFLLWFHLCTSSYIVEKNIQIMLFSSRFWIIFFPQGFFLLHYSLSLSLFHCYFIYLFMYSLFLSSFLSFFLHIYI